MGERLPSAFHSPKVVSLYAASEALCRQQRALNNFRQRDVVRPHLADVLLDPKVVAPLAVVEPENYFRENPDLDKKEAVAAALGSNDIMLLRGPSGTGKTTFSAELILQTLADQPGRAHPACLPDQRRDRQRDRTCF
jgi:hypothetical protein